MSGCLRIGLKSAWLAYAFACAATCLARLVGAGDLRVHRALARLKFARVVRSPFPEPPWLAQPPAHQGPTPPRSPRLKAAACTVGPEPVPMLTFRSMRRWRNASVRTPSRNGLTHVNTTQR